MCIMDSSLFAGFSLCFHGRPCAVLSKEGIEECWNIVNNIRAGTKKCELQPIIYPSRSWSTG